MKSVFLPLSALLLIGAPDRAPLVRALLVPPVPPSLVHLTIGATSGAAGAAAAYPLDLVKSTLQTSSGRARHGTDALAAAVDIVRTSPSGPLALYRGCLVQMAGIAPEKTIKLTTNDAVRAFLAAQYGGLTLGGEVLAGAVAGFCQVVVTNPLEVVKLKLQTTRDGDGYTLKDVWDEIGGAIGMYKGVLSCLARDVTFSAILFPGYAHLKTVLPALLAEHGAGDVNLIVVSLLAGSIAAAPAAFVGTPFDVVKTRLQQARERKDECLLELSYSTVPNDPVDACDDEEPSLGDILQQISDEGAFFSGWYQRCLRSCLQFGVTLSLFEMGNAKAAELGIL